MRPKCHCGKIAGYWYSPMLYRKLTFEEYLSNHAYCEEHADTENWAEYEYVGFHKKGWRWLKRKETELYLIGRNERLSAPYYDVSHVKADGIRWALGRYHSMENVLKETEGLVDVIIKEGWYE
jgi:hypothetical protein